MITAALICEYNPFHKGHKYMIDEIRKDGCDCIVAVMSGSFTQRGDVAVLSKFTRSEDALMGGADLIIELPTIWAVASAQRFAKGGTDIIKALGMVDRVYFGSECGDISLLKQVASATKDHRVSQCVKVLMNEGMYYPSALEKALREIHGDKVADIVTEPNNTLAIEYIKSLEGSGIEVRTIKRKGASHDSDEVADDIASASKIRSMIYRDENTDTLLPCTNQGVNNPASISFGERAFLYALRMLTPEDIEKLPDVSEGLENRIYESIRKNSTLEDIIADIKTKRYTHARLRRILTCGLLGVTKKLTDSPVPYIRILGFNPTGEKFVKEITKTCSLPVIINVAKDMKILSDSAREVLMLDIKATDVRTIFEETPSDCGSDYTTGLIKIKRI